MYESYFGLTSKPFQLNPDPNFYFGSNQHRRATAYLNYGLHQNEGFIVVTGEIGAGKTTIVRGLLNKLDSKEIVAANLVSTQLGADDTLRMVAAAFGVKTKDQGKSELLLSLEAFLVYKARQGKRCLLIVDEAQNLTPQAVEELRMLSNFQFETQALLQSFLIGQPEFRYIMQSPHMQQLRQRVIAACHIGPMNREETEGYIEHRLKCAGYSGLPLFDAEAYDAIFKASGGIPRRINSLCDRILLSGFLCDRREFKVEDVDDVTKELFEETQATEVPAQVRAGWANPDVSQVNEIAKTEILERGLSQMELDDSIAEETSQSIAGLRDSINEQRIIRLERSMIRIEQSTAATLALLQQLVNSIRVKTPEQEDK